MLPISLKIEGLNSYARKTEIDFTRFYSARLFGIFGDTGGGKSTILDAIILSLYGRTPRLSGQKIKEAINPFKKEINLEFSFRISGNTYLIKKIIGSGDSKIRLYKIQNDIQIPLAEKSTEFNEKIREIIGLSVEEFCKVVILPQNQFAELLQIEPAKRAELIGNIFDLNYFGEPLYRRFADKFAELKAILSEKQNKLNELNEVSTENIKNKEHELESLTVTITTLMEKHKELTERVNIIKNFIALCNQKKDLERKIEKIEAKHNEIEEIKRKIHLDEELSPYKKLFEDLKTLKSVIEENKEKKNSLENNLKTIDDRLQSIKKQKLEFEENYTIKSEELIKSITEADRWIELKKEIENLNKKNKQKNEEITRLTTILNTVEEEIRKTDSETTALIKETQKKQTLYEKSQLNEEEEKFYNVLLKNLSKIDEIKNLKKEIDKLNKNLIKETKKEKESLDKIQTLSEERLSLRIEDFDKLDEILSNKTRELKEAVEKNKEQLDNLQIKNLAFTLSRNLIKGKPCPVCGSTEHPEPAKCVDESEIIQRESESELLKKELENLESFKAEIKPDLNLIIKIKTNIEGYLRDIQEKSNKLSDLERELSCHIDQKYWEHAEEIINNLSGRKKEAEILMKSINDLNRQFNDKNTLYSNKKQEKIKLITNIEQIKNTLDELNIQISEKTESLLKNTKDKDPATLKHESEKELENLKKRKDELEKNLKETEEQKQKAVIEFEKIKSTLSKDEANCNEISKILEEQAKKRDISLIELEKLILDEKIKKAWKKQIEDYEKVHRASKGALDNIIKSLEELPIKEINEDEKEKTENDLNGTNEKIAQANQKAGALKEQIKKEKELLNEKITLTKEIKELEKHFENIKILKEITQGKEMIKFFSWYLLIDIVNLTNKLLKDLIGRRFIVNVKQNLEFTIKDLFYNTERSIHTLSGGETFLVSFVLALALSSYIQSKRKRAIQFFFIDEGFSSLDTDLLDSIYLVLNELKSQDRLVGLISHIEDLKQVIPQCINVRRDNTGSSVISLNP